MEDFVEHLSKIRVGLHFEAIHKDECMYSKDNPETPTGLYVSLSSFLGFGEKYVKKYAEESGNCVFLHIRRVKTLKEQADVQADDDGGGPEHKIARLAEGIEEGSNDSNSKEYESKDHYSIVVAPNIDKKIPFPNTELPSIVTKSAESIIAIDSALLELDKHVLAERQISKYSDTLTQLDNGKKIPSSDWKCEKCHLTNNLWLNLTDGSILCGRKHFDGSGGNDHAVEHYREVNYPLAVKLGTISTDGKADVFSYPEDEMVIDSKLEQHLAHFGINMAAMKKSEKSLVELEFEINETINECLHLSCNLYETE